MNHYTAPLEISNAEFLAAIRKQAVRIASRRKARSLTIDDLRNYAHQRGIAPRHPNAWGAVFRGQEWRSVDYRCSGIPSNHGRRVCVWRLA